MTLFRKLLGGRHKVSGPASVRRRPGALAQSPEERLERLYPRPSREQKKPIEWARELVGPGEVVWEIGAGDGVFAFAAAVLAGPAGEVLAVEEREKLAAALRRNAEQLGAPDARFEVLLSAVGAEVGDEAPGRKAPGMVTLDALLRRHRSPTVLRIAERMARPDLFAGAVHILRDVRPVVLIGVPQRLAPGLAPKLRGLGYELFDAEVNPSDRIKLDHAPRATLAVPSSQRAEEPER